MVVGSNIEEEVLRLVEGIIESDPSLFIVKVILKGNSGNQKLVVLLDGDDGITIDQCSQVSRKLSGILEELDLIDSKYFLEVSSAGLDFPLQSIRQYRKNIGRSLRVEVTNGEPVSGELKTVEEDKMLLEEQVKKEVVTHEINFSDIKKTMVLVSFK